MSKNPARLRRTIVNRTPHFAFQKQSPCARLTLSAEYQIDRSKLKLIPPISPSQSTLSQADIPVVSLSSERRLQAICANCVLRHLFSQFHFLRICFESRYSS